MKKILMIATGGTIASVLTEKGLAPGQDQNALLRAVPEIADICRVDAVQPMNMDSTNMRPAHWLVLAGLIRKN
ncbi:MAG: asparaginase, partial [Clostridia bacterium]|nr:asparaginase [Clostridia bacterium]MBQ9429050.1 asparaginase [Clostridia bacterium]